MKSVMDRNFSKVPAPNVPRSVFNRSHGLKTSFDCGDLVPVYVDEALPGDTHHMNMHAFGRLSTPLVPIMDNMFIDSFFFAVPIRLIWENWEKFNGAQDNPGDSIAYTIPTLTAPNGTGHLEGSLSDYLGIPTKISDLEHSSLWHRAYNLIWNEWFRDENLQDSVTVETDDGPDTMANYLTLLKRGKRYDYFTGCLPWPQKGTAVSLPLGTSAPVEFVDSVNYSNTYFMEASNADTEPTRLRLTSGGSATENVNVNRASGTFTTNTSPKLAEMQADLSSAVAATVNQLRESFQTQVLLERDARAGTRYVEILKSHFGVVSPDYRLQRPEYLGGGSTPININPIAQTSATDTGTSSGTPQGHLAAMGTLSVHGHGFSKSFTEHCVLIGLVSCRADINYQDGLDRMFTRSTRYDFYWPAFAHLGEQAVTNIEIYAQDPATDTGATGTPDNERVWGYQERWAEYRYKPSRVTGVFRSNHSASLDQYHLALDFASLPELDDTFIQDDPPTDRVMATPSEPDVIFDAYFNLKSARPMPVYSTPGLIDHF